MRDRYATDGDSTKNMDATLQALNKRFDDKASEPPKSYVFISFDPMLKGKVLNSTSALDVQLIMEKTQAAYSAK